MNFQDIPLTWLIALMFIGLVILRAIGIDTFVTAGLSIIIGYITGKHIESVRALENSLIPCEKKI